MPHTCLVFLGHFKKERISPCSPFWPVASNSSPASQCWDHDSWSHASHTAVSAQPIFCALLPPLLLCLGICLGICISCPLRHSSSPSVCPSVCHPFLSSHLPLLPTNSPASKLHLTQFNSDPEVREGSKPLQMFAPLFGFCLCSLVSASL